MAKFKKGDRVRRVSGEVSVYDLTPIGGINIVGEDDSNIPYGLNKSAYGARSVMAEEEYELAEDEEEVMEKYKFGDRVEVVCEENGHEFDIGSVVLITYVDPKDDELAYKCIDEDGYEWWLSDSEIIPATTKPHEWKFGDWARNEDGALGMVISNEHSARTVYFLRKGDVSAKLTDASTLTYISTAEIPA